jgi:beta-lactamase regulating signal transducer with metallopeptidase domain
VWGAGSAWCVVAVLVRVRRFRALVRCGTSAPPSVLAQVRCLCDQFGLRRPTCTMMPGDICPMVYGLFGRNRLLIPISLWERLMPSQQVSLLTHELAHLHRGDHWVRALEVVATVLYWWHPATWWARREVREAEEQCCDAWVGRLLPGSAAAYASALLDAVEFMSAKPTGSKGRRGSVAVAAATPAWASGLSEFQSLKRRLLMITSPSRVSPKLSAASLAAVLSLAGLSLPLSPVLAQTSTTPPAADVAPAEPTPAPRPKPVRAAPSVAPVAPAAQAAPAPTPAPAAVPDGDEARIIAGLRAQAGTTPIPAGTPSSSAATALPGDPFGTTAEERPGTPFAMPADPTDMKRDSQSTAANARRMAQLQRAQADVKRLSAELEAATRRLKDLEQATQSADMGKRAAEEGKRAAEMGKRAAEDAKRRAEDGKRAAEDAKRWAEDGKRSAEASKRAMDKWKMKQDTKLWKEGTTPDQPSGQPGEPNFGPVIINPPPGIGVHGNQYKEVTIRADGMPQIEVRELPRVSASEGVVGQPGTMPMPALRELAKNRNEELEQRLANLDRQLAELSGQVAALRGELKHQTAGPTKAPQPRER